MSFTLFSPNAPPIPSAIISIPIKTQALMILVVEFGFIQGACGGLQPAHLVSCILHLVSCILYLVSCILHLASCILYLVSCILHLVSMVYYNRRMLCRYKYLHPFGKQLHLNLNTLLHSMFAMWDPPTHSNATPPSGSRRRCW